MKSIRILIVCIFCLSLCSCVRYTHSRNEWNERIANGIDPIANRVGMDGFFRYEQEQRRRLELLIEDRETDEQVRDQVYRIGPGDEIKIKVKDFEEISKDYKVSPSGKITLPFLGELNVAGKTENQVSELISNKSQDFLVDPLVTTTVSEYSSNVVWVIGLNTHNNLGTNSKSKSGAYSLKHQGYSLVDLLVEIADPKLFSGGTVYLYPASEEGTSLLPGLDSSFDQYEPFYSMKSTGIAGELDEEQVCNGSELESEDGIRRWKACHPLNSKISDDEVRKKIPPSLKNRGRYRRVIWGDWSSTFKGTTQCRGYNYFKSSSNSTSPW